MKRAIVLGAGGHAKVVVATLQAQGALVEDLFDDDATRLGTSVLGALVRGPIANAALGGADGALVAIGDNAVRARIARGVRLPWGRAAHPTALLHEEVGEGTVAFARATVQVGSRIGRHAVLNTACIVDHDARVGDFAHVGPGAVLAGTVSVEEGALVGAGATVCPNLTIGAWSVVGAGAVVTRDVPPGATVAGVPARVIGHRPGEGGPA